MEQLYARINKQQEVLDSIIKIGHDDVAVALRRIDELEKRFMEYQNSNNQLYVELKSAFKARDDEINNVKRQIQEMSMEENESTGKKYDLKSIMKRYYEDKEIHPKKYTLQKVLQNTTDQQEKIIIAEKLAEPQKNKILDKMLKGIDHEKKQSEWTSEDYANYDLNKKFMEFKCIYCGRTGHTVRNCLDKKNGKPAKNPGWKTDYKKPTVTTTTTVTKNVKDGPSS